LGFAARGAEIEFGAAGATTTRAVGGAAPGTSGFAHARQYFLPSGLS
jgi:hypothetical protein